MMELPRVRIALNTSDNDLVSELYTPCLKWAEKYDRGVGFFSTGWLSYNLQGLSDFAYRGGRIRMITSPIISNADLDAILLAQEESEAYVLLNKALNENVEKLALEMQKDLYNTFAWMLHDGIIEIRFAVPRNSLISGNFHDKFGIFYSGDEALSFVGSINDSIQGIQNYESIKVFKTWAGTREYVESDIARFERIWNRRDTNLRVFSVPEAIKNKIFELRTGGRPYSVRQSVENNKWIHQDIAVEKFLEAEHGILAMATGTGKTITAIKIMKKLFQNNSIKRVIISMAGNDLLDQWAKQMRSTFQDMAIYTHYGASKEMSRFAIRPDNAILLLSSDASNLSRLLEMLERMPGDYHNDTLFVFDEVHGTGSASRVENLSGKLSVYRYRLGLSATPKREYDDERNSFIEEEIGPVIFSFGLEDAIRKGILCPFNYIPLSYSLTEEEKRKKRSIIASFNAKRKKGEAVNENDMYTQLALVNKTAAMKLDEFRELISQKPELLEKCIVFVQTQEYGEKVQRILLSYTDRYHTYYADDQKQNLEDFAAGNLECLLTCKKVSEGIDISRVANIILFSSDRSKLVTTQRIGRALRLDPLSPDKVATVVDFVIDDGLESDENTDSLRKEWLTALSKIRRDTDA